MGVFVALVVCIAILNIAEPKVPTNNGEDADVVTFCTNLEKRVHELELAMAKKESGKSMDSSSTFAENTKLKERLMSLEIQMTKTLENMKEELNNRHLLNDTNLEERVQALEFQMANVHDDIATINTEVADLEEDTEAQITIIQADISVINSEQNIQDTQLLAIENSVEAIEVDVARIEDVETSLSEVNESVIAVDNELGSLTEDVTRLNHSLTTMSEDLERVTEDVQELTDITDDLLVSVVSLQETDAGLMEDITQLTEIDGELDSRVSQLEVDGTFAFHAVLGTYTSIPENSVVVFPYINVNLGGGYNAETGQFITPSGGAGLYYFFIHFSLQSGEYAWMAIRHNGNFLSIMNEDAEETENFPASSAGAVVELQEGKNPQYGLLSYHWQSQF